MIVKIMGRVCIENSQIRAVGGREWRCQVKCISFNERKLWTINEMNYKDRKKNMSKRKMSDVANYPLEFTLL